MKKTLIWLLLLCLALPTALAENISFSGTVAAGQTVEVYAHATAVVETMHVKAGQHVNAGDALATLATAKTYAPMDGVVAAIVDGTVLLDEAVPFTVSADIAKAYDDQATKTVIPGETVYLRSRSDEECTGTGMVTAIDNTAYTVKGTAGSFIPGETVEVFRAADLAKESCLGRGTVNRTALTSVTTEDTIVNVAVAAGASVKQGDLLLESLAGTADSPVLTAPVSGTVAQISVTQGSSATDGAAVMVLYPDDAMVIECSIPETDLGYISVGDTVNITFLWNEDTGLPFTGTVESIAAVPDEGTIAYTAIITFTPDATVRYGMSVTVEPAN